MRDPWRTLLTLAAACAVALPLGAQEPADAEEPRYEVGLESSSHIVRREEERLSFVYHTGPWEFEGLVATVTPRFREERDQIGFLVARAFDWGELTAVARLTDKPVGEDLLSGVRFARAAGRSSYGAEVTWGQADLSIDDFEVGDGESQFVGRVFWRRENGFEIELMSASSATFDVLRGAGELLERLPRTEIAGAETLADEYLDEGRLEDSAGVAVGFASGSLEARLYVKSGEQTIRGVVAGTDFTGFGGELEIAAPSWSFSAELDARRIDGFDTYERGRALLDFRHRPGRFEWGVGGYVKGEAGTLADIPDVYDTAGAGVTFSWERAGGARTGFWLMWEDDAPDLHTASRLGAFYRTADREYGVGLRRDEVIEDETFGPFVFGKIPFERFVLQGDFGIQDSEVYGTLSLSFQR